MRSIAKPRMTSQIDEVLVRNLGRDGMETHLFKHLNNKPLHEMISAQELAEAEHARHD